MAATTQRAVRSRALTAAAIVVLVAVPFVVLGARLVAGHWLSFSDWASIELRTRDVGTRHTPLVGPYSRYGWNHPGPLLFYALALPYHALGSAATGLLLGAVLVNAAALAFVGIALWRRGGAGGLAVGGAVVLLFVRALGGSFLIDPWNPYVIVLPMLATVLLAWSAVDGDQWALPVAVAFGSFAVQSHVGSALAVITALALAAGLMWRAWRTLVVAAVVGVVCWLPPLIDEVRPGGGNLGDLARFWTSSHGNITGWTAGARIAFANLGIPAPWMTGHTDLSAFAGGLPRWHVPFAIAVLVAALVVSVRRNDRQSAMLCVFAAAVIVATFVSASRIVDTPFDYVIKWMWIAGVLTWLAAAWTAWRAIVGTEMPARVVHAIAIAGCAVLIVVLTVVAVRADFPQAADERSIAAFAPSARATLRTLPQPILVDAAGDLRSRTTAAGILVLGIKDGIATRFSDDAAFVVGKHNTVRQSEARSRIVVADDDAADRYRSDPAYRSIAQYDPLSPAERAQRTAIAEDIHAVEAHGLEALAAWIRAHPDDYDTARRLDARGPRIELFLHR